MLVVGRVSKVHEEVRIRLHETSQLIEHNELYLEFDGENKGVKGCLEGEHVDIVKHDHCQVRKECEDLGKEQCDEKVAVHLCCTMSQELCSSPSVNRREGKLLQQESNDLYAFHNLHLVEPESVVRRAHSEGEYNDGRVKQEAVHDDRGKGAGQDHWILDNQIHSGPQHE